MEYIGKLYGKIGKNKYIPLIEATADFEKLKNDIKKREQQLVTLKIGLQDILNQENLSDCKQIANQLLNYSIFLIK